MCLIMSDIVCSLAFIYGLCVSHHSCFCIHCCYEAAVDVWMDFIPWLDLPCSAIEWFGSDTNVKEQVWTCLPYPGFENT